MGFAYRFTKTSLPVHCTPDTNSPMAVGALSPTVVVSLTDTLFPPQWVVSLYFVWEYYISRDSYDWTILIRIILMPLLCFLIWVIQVFANLCRYLVALGIGSMMIPVKAK